MIDIYKTWVQDAGVDGFRIDTVKHVNMEFWQRFGPALQGYAASLGNDDFFMFGEVFDANPAFMSQYTTEGKLQATRRLRLPGHRDGLRQGRSGDDRALRDKFFAEDDWFTDADSNAYSLPTFLGNHDMGRIGQFLADTGQHRRRRCTSATSSRHSLMYLTRGQPVVYYGDEQGFIGDGGDQDAREDMFPSQVASYNDNDLIGTDATTADANFDTDHPLYRHIGELSKLRDEHPTLADGAQIHRFATTRPGIYAFSRISAGENVEYVVAANNADSDEDGDLRHLRAGPEASRRIWPADTDARASATLKSDGDGQRDRPGACRCRRSCTGRPSRCRRTASRRRRRSTRPSAGGASAAAPRSASTFPAATSTRSPSPTDRSATTSWTALGTDDNAPYRVFHDVRAWPRARCSSTAPSSRTTTATSASQST